jgi:hypothetical protein
MLEGRTDDVDQPSGYRPVMMTYRCECSAGGRMGKAFVLAPPDEPRALRLLPRADLE